MDEFQKIISSLLRGKSLRAPFVVGTDESDYRESLIAKLKDYIRRLENLKQTGPISNWVKSNIKNFKMLNKSLINALDEYLTGSAGKAYDHIENMMGDEFVQNNIVHLKQPLNQYYNETNNTNSLYRVRYSDYLLTKRSDIFHIPFDKRHLVGTQRYSIAGLPCLYLGASLYVCWHEMGTPDLNKLYLSHFKINAENRFSEVDVLDFAYSLETLQHMDYERLLIYDNVETIEKMQSYLAIWPILLACSFNKEMGLSNFNIEYVIPNLLLQWIGKEKRPVSGLRYFSTKTVHLRHSTVGINYVFPPSVKEPKTSGYCVKLSETFVFSKPVSWQMIGTINESKFENSEKFVLTGNLEYQLVSKYKSTLFYSIEQRLNKIMECGKISDA